MTNAPAETTPEVVAIDPSAIEAERLERAAEALAGGRLVGFPTETVYGLGANALDEEAVEAIFAAKDRPAGHPLIVHVAEREQAAELAAGWGERADQLARVFWPGPLTLIVEKAAEVPDLVTGGLGTVGLRIPDHPVARALIEMAGVPVAAPSANPHKSLSPTRAEHVVSGLGGRVDIVVDAGSTRVGIESTVLTLAESTPTILRPGMIGREAIEAVIGPVEVAEGVEIVGEEARAAPGMARKHYAPEATLRIVQGEGLEEQVGRLEGPVGVVGLEGGTEVAAEQVARLPERADAYAEALYRRLHQLDASGCVHIVVEAPPTGESWRAVWDRLNRAAAR
jgi:L-threonylcarbamoyladenylate synthase